MSNNTAGAIADAFTSSTHCNSHGDSANVVDAIADMTTALRRIGSSITPNITGCTDTSGGHVESLTEAVMGMTAGLHEIASAIRELAGAVRGGQQ